MIEWSGKATLKRRNSVEIVKRSSSHRNKRHAISLPIDRRVSVKNTTSEAETSILENEQKLCIGAIYEKCNFNLCKFMKKGKVSAKKASSVRRKLNAIGRS